MSEWLIDIIKEWVLSLAYATEAWVLEWITPVNVTGDLTPDATCTYFKGGTQGGKPYYKRSPDGWFIWWDSTAEIWFITEVLGFAEASHWRREAPDILGEYTPFGVTGTATVAEGYKYLCKSFIDRGDPSSQDFETGDFILDNEWHELDLSVHVPAGAKGITAMQFFQSSNAGAAIWLRKAGNENIYNVSLHYSQVANNLLANDVTVPISHDRKIEYKLPNTTIQFFLTIKAWWL